MANCPLFLIWKIQELMAPRPAHGWLEALSLPIVSEHRKDARLVEGPGRGQACHMPPISGGASLQPGGCHTQLMDRGFTVDKKATRLCDCGSYTPRPRQVLLGEHSSSIPGTCSSALPLRWDLPRHSSVVGPRASVPFSLLER